MRLYKLENHLGKWKLAEGYVIFEPGVHYFSDLENTEDDLTGKEVNIINLYDGALIYFDKDGEYHLVDEDPLNEILGLLMDTANTGDISMQKLVVSMLDDYLAEPVVISKDKEKEYVEAKGE